MQELIASGGLINYAIDEMKAKWWKITIFQ
jgi:hypothetical protein